MDISLTIIHWVYLFIICIVIGAMILKRDVVLPCLLGVFIIGLIYTGNLVGATQTVFRGLLTAGTDLFDIMLIIALMVAMLKSLQSMGADVLMVSPVKKFMANPNIAFWALGGVMYLASLFFWPTPATALVGTILLPVAIKAGLPAISAAMAVNIFGHDMALSGDIIIQGAPGLSERTIGLAEGTLLPYVTTLSLITGLVAALIAFWMMKRELANNKIPINTIDVDGQKECGQSLDNTKGKIFAFLVPIIFILVIITMVTQEIRGGECTALLGGTGALILILSSIVQHGDEALEKVIGYLREGFLSAIKIFAPVIPIASFFFLGSESVVSILGEGAPEVLFDLGSALAATLPLNSIALAFGNLVIGIVTGLDGSGFSGIPLTASLANALGTPAGINIPALAAVGQMGAVWSGGGTLTAWAFGLVATAGVAGIPPLELARKNFIPIISGLIISTIFAIVIWM